jgi:hypothetical protein
VPSRPTDEPVEPDTREFENVEDYMHGFLAALRTHGALTGEQTFEIEVEEERDLPLAQRAMLR